MSYDVVKEKSAYGDFFNEEIYSTIVDDGVLSVRHIKQKHNSLGGLSDGAIEQIITDCLMLRNKSWDG